MCALTDTHTHPFVPNEMRSFVFVPVSAVATRSCFVLRVRTDICITLLLFLKQELQMLHIEWNERKCGWRKEEKLRKSRMKKPILIFSRMILMIER